jgi:hypothetical protein
MTRLWVTVPLFILASGCTSANCADAKAPVLLSAPPPEPAVPREPVPTRTALPPAAARSAAAERALSVVRRLHGGDARHVYSECSLEFRSAISLDKFLGVIRDVEADAGRLSDARVLDESRGKPRTTVWVAGFFERGARNFSVTLDDQGVIQGLWVKSFGDSRERGVGPADDYVTKNSYVVPARGAWHVANGGREVGGNIHVGNREQWYAFDLDRRGPDGKDATGDGAKPEQHLAWEQPVVAPADGQVVTVVNGVADHGLDYRDGYIVPGNLVVIDHGSSEFSFLAHLKKDSIVVRPGQRVKRGQVLGKVGNSGNTTGPHLHWHLGTEAEMGRGHGLPIRFAPLLVNGARVEAPQPAHGDTIETP